ncbi:MAG: AtpZ/AtpI family protein [Bacteroidota bacterium]
MQKDPDKNKKKNLENLNKGLQSYAKYSALAFQMVIIMLAGVFGGIKLDEITGLGFPVFTVVLSLAAVGLALYYALKDL